MRTGIPALLLVGALWSAASFAQGRDPAPDYFIANCFNCHGSDGRSTGAIPSLAGRDKAYLIAQMKAFKDGTRQATVMHQLAKGYSDEEIARAADYYARQKK